LKEKSIKKDKRITDIDWAAEVDALTRSDYRTTRDGCSVSRLARFAPP